ncbi:hypothetical protein RchiOBHm_Chr1g0317551 [Rosa chinensis]|uniref:Uncharacterized protein n=1 Tax=Rosa chinensis TaxID=74649 RepID=A0A2P6S7Y5_ROSCH|nr:hypothetical protein RchiOBHm_Chr1g0317551 [Rosa chinensis]
MRYHLVSCSVLALIGLVGCKTSVCSLCWLAARKWILIYWLSFSWMPIIAKTNLIMLW